MKTDYYWWEDLPPDIQSGVPRREDGFARRYVSVTETDRGQLVCWLDVSYAFLAGCRSHIDIMRQELGKTIKKKVSP